MSKNRQWWEKRPKWRRIQRQVSQKEIPELWELMKADGVWIHLTSTGYQLMVGSYNITKRSLGDSWKINMNATGRVINHALDNNDLGFEIGWDE